MNRIPAAVLLLLAVAGCSRSPEEQLAYRHAEEQYQINIRNAERLRQYPEGAVDDPDPERSLRSRE